MLLHECQRRSDMTIKEALFDIPAESLHYEDDISTFVILLLYFYWLLTKQL